MSITRLKQQLKSILDNVSTDAKRINELLLVNMAKPSKDEITSKLTKDIMRLKSIQSQDEVEELTEIIVMLQDITSTNVKYRDKELNDELLKVLKHIKILVEQVESIVSVFEHKLCENNINAEVIKNDTQQITKKEPVTIKKILLTMLPKSNIGNTVMWGIIGIIAVVLIGNNAPQAFTDATKLLKELNRIKVVPNEQ